MTGEEAKKYGLIDSVITSRTEVVKGKKKDNTEVEKDKKKDNK